MKIVPNPYLDQLDHIAKECFVVDSQPIVLDGNVIVFNFAFICDTQCVVTRIVGTLADQEHSVFERSHQLFHVVPRYITMVPAAKHGNYGVTRLDQKALSSTSSI